MPGRELPDRQLLTTLGQTASINYHGRRPLSAHEPWPAWATEPIELLDPDPAWAPRGEQERNQLEGLRAPWLTRRIEHVGSTAIPGLPAKPIIDLQAAVTDLATATPAGAVLAPHGWHLMDPELDQRPWRRFFIKVTDDHRSAHLHLMTTETPRWEQQLAFRDTLRGAPSLTTAYAELKRELATRHANDREAYAAAKADFIHMVLDRSS
jgi:GrpB-like predicted nucleotidyltransferase (UPF0157 family)